MTGGVSILGITLGSKVDLGPILPNVKHGLVVCEIANLKRCMEPNLKSGGRGAKFSGFFEVSAKVRRNYPLSNTIKLWQTVIVGQVLGVF